MSDSLRMLAWNACDNMFCVLFLDMFGVFFVLKNIIEHNGQLLALINYTDRVFRTFSFFSSQQFLGILSFLNLCCQSILGRSAAATPPLFTNSKQLFTLVVSSKLIFSYSVFYSVLLDMERRSTVMKSNASEYQFLLPLKC